MAQSLRPSNLSLLTALNAAGCWRTTQDVLRAVLGTAEHTVMAGREYISRLAATRTALDNLARAGKVERRKHGNAILWRLSEGGDA